MDSSTVPLLWITACYCLVISVLGSIANIIALICIVKSPNLNSGMKVILFNAFLPSLLISSLIMPFLFKLFFPPSSIREERGRIFFECKERIPLPNLFFGLLSAFTLIELIGLALLSFYRLLAISSPSKYTRWISVKRAVIICAATWILSITTWGILVGLRYIIFDPHDCFIEGNNIVIQRIILSLLYGIPLVLTVIFILTTRIKIYRQISKKKAMRSSAQSLPENKNSLEAESTLSTQSSSSNLESPNKQQQQSKTEPKDDEMNPTSSLRKNNSFYKKGVHLISRYYTFRTYNHKKEANRFLKATHNIWIIFALFCVMNIPHVVVHIVVVHKTVAFVFILLHLIHWIHLVVDPLIYLVLNKRDSLHVLKLIKNKSKCCSA